MGIKTLYGFSYITVGSSYVTIRYGWESALNIYGIITYGAPIEIIITPDFFIGPSPAQAAPGAEASPGCEGK